MDTYDWERRGIPPELSWLERAFLATQRFANKDFEWRPPSGGEDEAQEDYIKRQLYEGYRGERVYGPRRPAPSVAQVPLESSQMGQQQFDPRYARTDARDIHSGTGRWGGDPRGEDKYRRVRTIWNNNPNQVPLPLDQPLSLRPKVLF